MSTLRAVEALGETSANTLAVDAEMAAPLSPPQWEALMRGPLPLNLGDVVRLKKGHPCGANEWEVVRLGADIKIKCHGCGRLVMLPRSELERRIRAFLSQNTPDPAGTE
jgi:hypothetical protein